MDWLTALIVAVGLLILGLWTVVPITEFRSIFRELRARRPVDPIDSTPQRDRP